MGRDHVIDREISGIHINVNVPVSSQSPYAGTGDDQSAGFLNENIATGVIGCDQCPDRRIDVSCTAG